MTNVQLVNLQQNIDEQIVVQCCCRFYQILLLNKQFSIESSGQWNWFIFTSCCCMFMHAKIGCDAMSKQKLLFLNYLESQLVETKRTDNSVCFIKERTQTHTRTINTKPTQIWPKQCIAAFMIIHVRTTILALPVYVLL